MDELSIYFYFKMSYLLDWEIKTSEFFGQWIEKSQVLPDGRKHGLSVVYDEKGNIWSQKIYHAGKSITGYEYDD